MIIPEEHETAPVRYIYYRAKRDNFFSQLLPLQDEDGFADSTSFPCMFYYHSIVIISA